MSRHVKWWKRVVDDYQISQTPLINRITQFISIIVDYIKVSEKKEKQTKAPNTYKVKSSSSDFNVGNIQNVMNSHLDGWWRGGKRERKNVEQKVDKLWKASEDFPRFFSFSIGKHGAKFHPRLFSK